MQKRNVLNSPRLLKLKKGRRRVILVKILLSVFALLVIFAGLVYISRVPFFNFKGVEITGNKAVDAENIKISIEKEIAGNYLKLFPKTNILFYPKNNIKKELFNQFKKLKDINFSIKDNKILEVSVTEREAKYLWCGENLVVGAPSDEKCSFVDESGYVFDLAPYFSGNVYFKFFGPLAGDYFFPDIFRKVLAFKDTLIHMGFKLVSLYILDNGDIKIFLSNSDKTLIGPYITLKADSDFQKVAENLQTALSTEPLQSNFKNKYSSLEYIDLRFGNKVVYKFK